MSLLSRLFGFGGSSKGADPASPPTQEHGGFTILATPYEVSGRFQLCGAITKEIDGVVKEHRFIRADTLGSMEDAVSMTFFKGRQIIDQMGEDVFRQG